MMQGGGVNPVNNSNLISGASGGHMRAGSYHIPERGFHSTQQMNNQGGSGSGVPSALHTRHSNSSGQGAKGQSAYLSG